MVIKEVWKWGNMCAISRGVFGIGVKNRVYGRRS